MVFIKSALLTKYGISVITIISRFFSVSISALPRITIRPRPVLNASITPLYPYMKPPVGKSGALIYSINPEISISRSSM